MKKRFSKPVRFLCLLCLPFWAVAPGVWAQSPPRLTLEFPASYPTLSLTGETGTVYSIQYASDLSPTNHWTDRTLIQVQGARTLWTDPSALTSSQRFYRAVSVAPAADTNLVFIQPGTFTMGSPTNEALRFSDETQHLVTISRGFWMGKHLVTQGDYLAVVGSNPSYFTPTNGYSQDLTRPVEQVHWSDATNYCALLTARELAAGRIPTNYEYRLPTESEWEYACRAGTTTAFYLGSRLSSGDANFWGQHEYDASAGQIINASGIYLKTTTPVGSYAANGWGLYDMIGNVWEWCEDWYGPYPAGPVTDPQGAASASNRLARGGDWGGYARFCRSAQRSGSVPSPTSRRTGFRAVLAPVQL
jgi:formylglycine-generating enzyme required for sulfatase activity